MSTANLQIEWNRLELLAEFVSNNRAGKATSEARRQELKVAQSGVNEIREQKPWRDVVEQCGLNRLDQDILACTLGPESSPQLGWMYQELQPGLASNYPSQALIQELLFIDANESKSLHERLLPGAPLARNNLLKVTGLVPKYQPLRPSDKATETFLGYSNLGTEIPGAIQLPTYGNWKDLIQIGRASCRERVCMFV